MRAPGIRRADHRGRTATLAQPRPRPVWSAMVAALTLAVIAGASAWPAAAPEPVMASVIVIDQPGGFNAAVRAVSALGGRMVRRLSIVDGFTADIPQTALEALRSSPGIMSVTPDVALGLLGRDGSSGDDGSPGSMALAAGTVGAMEAWKDGITGAGVDVALIDSGVSPVSGLAADGQIVNGPDLSFDLQAGAEASLDAFGHGTHLAGIIAGRDAAGDEDGELEDAQFVGVAPGARIVSVKVAGAAGQTDVSQVIAAIDWVVQHRQDDGLNIRVLNLAFGTDGTQDYRVDPLAHAVEAAWRSGIVVVVAAGNAGETRTGLANPATDPFVIAVGADDPNGTVSTSDDTVPDWSSRGDGTRNPDVIAPGSSIRSLRVPGSTLDLAVPAATAGGRYINGSGTSQAAAIVSGTVALILEDRPNLTPDQVKALLMTTASRLSSAGPEAQGAGLVNVERAIETRAPSTVQGFARASGTGSLEGARGSVHVMADGIALNDERDIFGAAWDGAARASLSASATAWAGGTWNGNAWSGLSWSGLSWSSR